MGSASGSEPASTPANASAPRTTSPASRSTSAPASPQRPGRERSWFSRTVRDLVAGSGVDLQARGVHRLKGVPEPYELFSLVDGRVAPVPVAATRPVLKLSDRIVLTAARRAPRLLRAMNRS